ncbi:ACT domain-containing protein [uncultured Marinobacter sp.]|uniref:ACT domain-containing protein n=1 Tax=uncultured Marinobacter sp. TaxID=187379 RepID=UPI002637F57F|nr:ACT domain-containing protein [uncultured Marinobacter sp.]
MTTESSCKAPSYNITCRMSHEAAALERLCQVVRVRGFRIAKMAVDSADGALNIALTIQGTRPVAMLQSQLEKLHTVAEVKLAAPVVAAASRIA